MIHFTPWCLLLTFALCVFYRLPSSTRALEVTRSGEIYQRALEIVLRHVEESMADGHKYNMTYSKKRGRK